jgi:hypothetical protein
MSCKIFVGLFLLAVICLSSSCEKNYDFSPPAAAQKTLITRVYITKIEVLNFDFNKSNINNSDPDLKPEVYLNIYRTDSGDIYTNVINTVSPSDLPLAYNLTTPVSCPISDGWTTLTIYDRDGPTPQPLNDDLLGGKSLHFYYSDYYPGYTGYQILFTDGDHAALKVYFRCE